MPDEVVIIGCGPGGRDYLLPAAIAAAQGVDNLAGTERLFSLFPDYRGEKVLFDGRDVLAFCQKLSGLPGRVGVLVSGSPSLYSLAGKVVEYFGRARCRIVAGISSVEVAACRLALPLDKLMIFSAHTPEPAELKNFLAVIKNIPDAGSIPSGFSGVIILGGNKANNNLICEFIECLCCCAGAGKSFNAGLVYGETKKNTPEIFYLKDLTLPEESIKKIQITDISSLVGRSREIIVISYL